MRKFLTFGLLGLGALAAIIGASMAPSDAPTEGTAAVEASKEFVRAQLKAPAGASFSPLAETGYEHRKDGMFIVSGWVDSQNSFGANLRENWAAVVRRDTAGWHQVWLKIGTEVTGDFPADSN